MGGRKQSERREKDRGWEGRRVHVRRHGVKPGGVNQRLTDTGVSLSATLSHAYLLVA